MLFNEDLESISIDELVAFLTPERIGYDESSDWVVSTINSRDLGYETAIQHQRFNDANFIVVERYNTKNDARLGHQNWLSKMQNEPDIEELYSVDLFETYARSKRIIIKQ